MELKVIGKLTNILNPVSGISKSGKEWNKQNFVITTDDKYPKLICFTLFSDKTDLVSNIKLGDEIEVFFNLESREYNEKWYTNNPNAWKILLVQSEAPKNDVEDNPANNTAAEHNKQFDEPTYVEKTEGTDDLPF